MQKGFTLIELMIVVAIIGILAAIAIPQYQDYITRAKWQDNISRVQSYKTAIAECLQNNNGFITLCDSTDKISATTGAVPPTTGAPSNLSAFTQTATTGAMVLGGTPSVGDCTVTITPAVSTTSVAWSYTNTGTGCGKSKTGVGT
jgi:type IV pilus assembly protein PilA